MAVALLKKPRTNSFSHSLYLSPRSDIVEFEKFVLPVLIPFRHAFPSVSQRNMNCPDTGFVPSMDTRAIILPPRANEFLTEARTSM